MKKLISLLTCLLLIGCGEKKESSDNAEPPQDTGSARAANEEAKASKADQDFLKGKPSSTPQKEKPKTGKDVPPEGPNSDEEGNISKTRESGVIGYWAPDLKAMLTALEALEKNPPKGGWFAEEFAEERKKIMKNEWLKEVRVWAFSEDGEFAEIYNDTKDGKSSGIYRMNIESEEDGVKVFRVEVENDSNQFSLITKSDTMTVLNEVPLYPMILHRINEAEFKKRMARGKELSQHYEELMKSAKSHLIGYWAIDLEKTLKALEVNPPENSDSDQLDEMKKMLMEDEDAQTTVWMFSEKGKFTDYSYSDTRADTRIGWYEVMSKEDEGKAFRVEVNIPANGALQQHRQFSLMAKGDTMTIITNDITFMLSRIDESQFEKRMALGKKRNLYYEELRKAAEREAEEADK